MNVDSMSAISMVTKPKFNSRSKHVEIKYHFVWEKAENREIEIPYLRSKKLMADALTKTFIAEEFVRHVMCMGLKIHLMYIGTFDNHSVCAK